MITVTTILAVDAAIFWGAAGVIATVALALLATIGKRRAARKAMEPELVFQPLRLFDPGTHPRREYEYAIGFRVRNIGTGTAVQPQYLLPDRRGELFAEVVMRAELLPGDEWIEFAGIRGQEQEDNPSKAEVEAFFRRVVPIVPCFDRLRRPYVFHPRGGGRVRRKDRKAFPFKTPYEMAKAALAYPSRGQRGETLGP